MFSLKHPIRYSIRYSCVVNNTSPCEFVMTYRRKRRQVDESLREDFKSSRNVILFYDARLKCVLKGYDTYDSLIPLCRRKRRKKGGGKRCFAARKRIKVSRLDEYITVSRRHHFETAIMKHSKAPSQSSYLYERIMRDGGTRLLFL